MDGTLTPARKPMNKEMKEKILHLLEKVDVGIVSGSGIKLIQEQVPFDILSKIEIFPCNGTQRWVSVDNQLKQIGESILMKEKIGKSTWDHLMRNLHNLQSSFMLSCKDLPYTSDFISDRGTMVNWCPIGRNANFEERSAWIEYDQKNSARNWLKNRLKLEMNGKGYLVQNHGPLSYKLGGQTSIDIYPVGWDKTCALNHLPNKNVWFVGDKCDNHGNDFEIFEFAKKKNQAYHVHSHDETLSVIDEIITRI
jgi:phosphomannomutase